MRHISILVLNRRAPSAAAVRAPLNPPCHRMNYSSESRRGKFPLPVCQSQNKNNVLARGKRAKSITLVILQSLLEVVSLRTRLSLGRIVFFFFAE